MLGAPLLRWLLPALCVRSAGGVLRYPDGSFESRSPLHVDECNLTARPSPDRAACLQQLRSHLLEDADCNRVICDQINSSSPIEWYANHSDWAPFKNLCGNLREFFTCAFDVGLRLATHGETPRDEPELMECWRVLTSSFAAWFHSEEEGAPSYANSTMAVLRHHVSEVLAAAAVAGRVPPSVSGVLDSAVAVARRIQMLIENLSVTLLLNYHIARLEQNGRLVHERNLLHEMYGDVSLVKVQFHEIPGKRWDALTFLLNHLGVAAAQVSMAEIGVENGNTSQRLLERNPNLQYVGVDPYVNLDGLHQSVTRRLAPYTASGRLTLHRNTSLLACELVADGSLDLVFLDARHDAEAVVNDILAWYRKVRPGGVLAGHDFSWMFPPLAMAVYKAAFWVPERTIHLAPDGVWWFQL